MEPSFISQAGGILLVIFLVWLMYTAIEWYKARYRCDHYFEFSRVGKEPVFQCSKCGIIETIKPGEL